MTTPLNAGEIAHHAQHRLLLGAHDMRGSDEFRGAAELGARSGRRDLRHRLAAPYQRSGIGLHAGAGFDGHGFAGEHGLVEQDFSGVSRTSAATTAPSESFTTSPGTSSAAGMVFQVPSRRTDALSASRDFSAARVAWARLSWNNPSAALNTRRAAMIAASTYLPSTSSSTIAASSIHGTGAQNFSSALRNGCSAVSGIAFGPNFSRWRRASSLVRPPGGLSSTAC